MGTKIFMTGTTGFVGTYLAGHLINEGHAVTVLTPALKSTDLKMAGLSYLPGNPTVR
jgi:nucleoside-diphosphate-sugar epimerase